MARYFDCHFAQALRVQSPKRNVFFSYRIPIKQSFDRIDTETSGCNTLRRPRKNVLVDAFDWLLVQGVAPSSIQKPCNIPERPGFNKKHTASPRLLQQILPFQRARSNGLNGGSPRASRQRKHAASSHGSKNMLRR